MTSIHATPPDAPATMKPPLNSTPAASSDFLAAIDGRVEPVRIRPTYRIALLAITAGMLLLPLVYIAIICLIGFMVVLFYSSVSFAGFTTGTWSTLFFYFVPGFVGCSALAFMLKPLFARFPGHTPVILSETEQHQLYAYVGRLCAIMGAPAPSLIQVDCHANASASFDKGREGLVGGRVVLTIGLPLVASLSLRQLTGVLAHEFGHFTQGTGMRLTYVVRTINLWFTRAVYERDMWDMLVENAAHSRGSAAFYAWGWLTKFLVWLTRRALWVLMCIGDLLSSAMLRQMEFDADRYGARVAGSDVFEETSERIHALARAEDKAINEIRAACRKGRLCDDFNRLVVERETSTLPEARASALKKLRNQTTDWFDTHPSHKDRVSSAKRENAPGIVRGDGPARALFHDFDSLSRRATELFYRKDMGIQYDASHVISTEGMLAGSDDHEAVLRVLTRFFLGLINPICPIFPELTPELPDSTVAVTELVDAARRRMLDLAESARTALAECDSADERLVLAIRNKAVGRPCPADALQAFDADRLSHAASVTAATMQGMTRVNIALALRQRDPKRASVESPVAPENSRDDSHDAVLNALLKLKEAAPELEKLRLNFYALDAALLLSQSDNRGESIRLILDQSERNHFHLRNIHDILGAATYPYTRTAGRVTLAQYAVSRLPAPNEIGAVHTTSQAALKSIYSLYLRLLSDLVHRTESLEASLGLEQLPEPPNSEALIEKLRSRYGF